MVLSYILLALAGGAFLAFIIRSIVFFLKNRQNVPDCSLSEARELYEKNRKAFINLLIGGSVGLIATCFIFGASIPLLQFILIILFLVVFLVIGGIYSYQNMFLAKQRIQQLSSLKQEERL